MQVKDTIHQTRHISKVEERILTGPQQFLKFSHRWPTGSMWTGHWDSLGMAGAGTYMMPHGKFLFFISVAHRELSQDGA